MCSNPLRYFDASELQEITLAVGDVKAFPVTGCGSTGSCTSVRYIATASDSTGAGVFSWYLAKDASSKDEAVKKHDFQSLTQGMSAWTHTETRCAFEDVGLTTPKDAGNEMWFLLVCESDSPTACIVNTAVSYRKNAAVASPSPAPSSARGVTQEQLDQIPTPTRYERIHAGRALTLPVTGCGGGSCTINFASALVDTEHGNAAMRVDGAAVAAGTAPSRSRRLQATGAFGGRGAFVKVDDFATPRGTDTYHVRIHCEGADGVWCDVMYGMRAELPEPGTAAAPDVPAAAARGAPGSECQFSTECAVSASCRGGRCCDAIAGSPDSSCAACGADGSCAISSSSRLTMPEDSCGGTAVAAACGGSANAQCRLAVAPDGSTRAQGSCTCGNEVRHWGSGSGRNTYSPCSSYITYVQGDARAAKTAQERVDSGMSPVTPENGGDGGAGAAAGAVLGLMVVGVVGYLYYQHYQETKDLTPMERAKRGNPVVNAAKSAATRARAAARSMRMGGRSSVGSKWETVDEDDIPDIDDDDDDDEDPAPPVAVMPAAFGRLDRVRRGQHGAPRRSSAKPGRDSPLQQAASGRSVDSDQFNPLHVAGSSV